MIALHAFGDPGNPVGDRTFLFWGKLKLIGTLRCFLVGHCALAISMAIIELFSAVSWFDWGQGDAARRAF